MAQVAENVGDPNLASFTRAFSDAYRTTPTAFRKRGELRPVPLTLPQKEPLMYPVTLGTEPAHRLAAMPHKGPYPEIGRAFEKLGTTVAARGFYGRFGKMVGVYYDSPVGLPAAYDQLFGLWLPQSGEEVADSPVFEVCLNSPMDTAPEDLLTEICLPLKG